MGWKNLFCWAVVVLFMTACASKSNMESFLREDVDLAYVTKVAVAPFENNSKEPFAAERIRGLAITQILAQGLFDVVDKSLVDSALREEAIDLNKAPMDAATMKRLGQRLVVQAFLLGSVDQAGVVQRGNNSYPELSVTLRLVDTNTGMIFWQASGNRTGESMGKRLFGFSSDDDFKIALKLLRQIFATISAEKKVKLPTPAVAPKAVQQVDSLEGQGTAADQIAPEATPGEADSLETPLDTGEPQEAIDPLVPGAGAEQAVPMGLDESLSQEEAPAAPAPAEQGAPLAQERPAEPTGDGRAEPAMAPDQGTGQDAPLDPDKPPAPTPAAPPGDSAQPSAPLEPVVVPPDQGGQLDWPE